MCINGTRKNHSRSQWHDFTALLKLCIAVYVLGNSAPWASGCTFLPPFKQKILYETLIDTIEIQPKFTLRSWRNKIIVIIDRALYHACDNYVYRPTVSVRRTVYKVSVYILLYTKSMTYIQLINSLCDSCVCSRVLVQKPVCDIDHFIGCPFRYESLFLPLQYQLNMRRFTSKPDYVAKLFA